MDLQTIISIAGLILFAFVMMRGCGGLAGGGCGMGHGRQHSAGEPDKTVGKKESNSSSY